MRRPLVILCLTIVLCVAIYLRIYPPAEFSYGEAAGKEVCLVGQVYKKEIQKGQNGPILLLYLKPEVLRFQQQNIPFENNFICALESGSNEPPIGSRAFLTGILQEYEHATNPGLFDAKDYYATMDVSAKINGCQVVCTEIPNCYLWEKMWQLRRFLCKVTDNIFEEETAAFLKAMLLGEKSDMDAETKELYKEAGVLHIIAISGTHISLIGMGLYKLLRKLYVPITPASVCCGILMLLYGVMIGMPVSALRAIIMFLLRLLAKCTGRTYDMQTALLLCGACMVLENPLYLYHAGFLLSFSAVWAVCVLKPALAPSEQKITAGPIATPAATPLKWQSLSQLFSIASATPLVKQQLPSRLFSIASATPPVKQQLPSSLSSKGQPWIVDSLLTSFSVAVFTLPVQLFFYYEVSVYAVIWNLVVIPLAGVCMGAAMVAIFTGMFAPIVAKLPAICAAAIILLYEKGSFLVGEMPGNLWRTGKPEKWQIIIFFLLAGVVVLLKKLEPRYKIGLLCGAVLLLGVELRSELDVTFLDVGQGDCICLQLPDGTTWLCDGGSSDVSDVGQYRIEPFLKHEGIEVLDAVFLSHADSDHIGGVEELLQRDAVEIKLLVLPCTELTEAGTWRTGFADILQLAEVKGIPVFWLEAGMQWRNGDVFAQCLHPAEDFKTEDENAASQVLYITYGSFSLLLTGDVEEDGETALLAELKRQDIENVTILKVAHHGSKYSCGEAFLEQINPQLSVISCGENNWYGHPHDETLERLADVGSIVLTTPEYGAVTVTVEENGQVEVRSILNPTR
ncbi:MAG: ComEC/Rec2 family competence protein [Lachnospiraceae bacterium]|nr:ComEC/Rec2 family competence protein [Lachnospiraceae bacterium]